PAGQFFDRRTRQEWRLVRLGRGRQDRDAEGSVCTLVFARGAEEDRNRDPAGSLRPGDLRAAWAVHDPERLAEVAVRRARRSGDADLLEHRQERVGRLEAAGTVLFDECEASFPWGNGASILLTDSYQLGYSLAGPPVRWI